MSLLRLLNKCLKLPTDINKIISYMVSDDVFVIGRVYYDLCYTGLKKNNIKIYEESCKLFIIVARDDKKIYIRPYDNNNNLENFTKERVILKKDGLEAIRMNYKIFYSNNKPSVNEYIINLKTTV